uniref:Uncharacterized protein n=1 Tax=Anguilla anguilla TaxID=7936 RepID=A0A0E9UBV8_ANGAN
MLLKCSLKSLQ